MKDDIDDENYVDAPFWGAVILALLVGGTAVWALLLGRYVFGLY